MIITINEKPCECEKGEMLLTVARRNGIEIPTLCHHEAIAGQGCCRLCIVEVVEKGRSKVVVSCVYPVEKECEVFTESDRIKRERAMVLRLLSGRAPESIEIKELCEKYNVSKVERFVKAADSKCVLCGLCAKACAELSVGAISTVNRGVTKEISTPYHEPSSVCVGCGSCARICPTGAIKMEEDEETRTIWGKTFKLVRCERCNKPFATKEELELSAEKAGEEKQVLCEQCRKLSIADIYANVFGHISK